MLLLPVDPDSSSTPLGWPASCCSVRAQDADIATLALCTGAQYFVGTHYSEGCQVARLLFSKAERQALAELARQMDLGLGRMVQGMIKFMSNPAHWEQHPSDASRGMRVSAAMQCGAAGKAAREECFLGDFKGKLRLSAAVCDGPVL